MAVETVNVPITLGFVAASSAIPDPEHPGFARAGARAGAPYGGGDLERHVCVAADWSRGGFEPDLCTTGFDTVDLSGFATLQQVFARVHEAGRITDDDASLIRSEMDGATLRCSNGRRVRVVYVAPEGLIMRRAGPNGLDITGQRTIGMNGHGPATSVHADQDVEGTPLLQLMEGRAPQLLRHDSPGAHNHDAALMLVNVWIPLHQITQPLVFADGRSIDRRSSQLRHGLATGTFLERDDDMAINDIWLFLHDDSQQWYLRSAMDHRAAYVFNTTSTAHGAASMAGEALAEELYRSLEQLEAAAADGDARAFTSTVDGIGPVVVPPGTPPALAAAIASMVAVVDTARRDPAAVCGPDTQSWIASARSARSSVVRESIEMRMVVSLVDES
ncbi:MAG: hypothetical protein JST73_11685 [Actinobacteria bacterium]|nr:hypothetical protein [Actinomycetota bacterium]